MSVSVSTPRGATRLTAADGVVEGGALRVTLTGEGPRRAAVFVNEAVTETDADGGFACEVLLEPGEGWLVAGLLTGCACVTQKTAVVVEI